MVRWFCLKNLNLHAFALHTIPSIEIGTYGRYDIGPVGNAKTTPKEPWLSKWSRFTYSPFYFFLRFWIYKFFYKRRRNILSSLSLSTFGSYLVFFFNSGVNSRCLSSLRCLRQTALRNTISYNCIWYAFPCWIQVCLIYLHQIQCVANRRQGGKTFKLV